MPQAINKIGKKIKELQRAPDKVKTRWFIGATSLSMTIVIGLWIAYLNAALPEITKPSAANAPKDATGAIRKESTSEVFNRGLQAITDDFKEKFNLLKEQMNVKTNVLKNQLERKNEFSVRIQTADDFLPAEGEEIPPTPLP